MTLDQIKQLQKENGLDEMQKLIDCGEVWKMEGSMGRNAMQLLELGACMLPEEDYQDFYGNMIPSRNRLKPGTKGTFDNSVNYWKGFL